MQVPICKPLVYMDFFSNRMVFVYPLVENSTTFMAACLSFLPIHLLPTVLEATKRVFLPTESAGHAWLCLETANNGISLSLATKITN